MRTQVNVEVKEIKSDASIITDDRGLIRYRKNSNYFDVESTIQITELGTPVVSMELTFNLFVQEGDLSFNEAKKRIEELLINIEGACK